MQFMGKLELLTGDCWDRMAVIVSEEIGEFQKIRMCLR